MRQPSAEQPANQEEKGKEKSRPIEPEIKQRKFMSDYDEELRKTDIPEKLQHRASLCKEPSSNSEEALTEESKWIWQQHFREKYGEDAAAVSHQVLAHLFLCILSFVFNLMYLFASFCGTFSTMHARSLHDHLCFV